MNEMEKRKKLVDYINGMGVEEKIALHNTYCDAANCMDDCIYTMDEMEEFSTALTSGNSFAWFGSETLTSWKTSGASWELPIFAEDIADYILSAEDSLGNDEIQEILDKEDNDNE